MAEEEFEIYLSLLSRLLRLSPKQRCEIADELRDHLQERCEVLARQGVSRVEAVRSALGELGEAAELAQQFTQIAVFRRRRRLMRWSLGSIAVVASVVVVALAFWPQSSVVVAPGRAVAQAVVESAASEPSELTPKLVTSESEANARAEAKLATRIDGVEFIETPLEDVFSFISELTDVDILIDTQSLSEEGIPTDDPVALTIQHTSPAASTILDLVLEPRGLAYRLRDGIVYVETVTLAEEACEARAYDCSDLVDHKTGATSQPLGQEEELMSYDEDSDEGEESYEVSTKPAAKRELSSDRSIESLMDVLQLSTSGPWMDSDGTGGAMVAFGDVLIVRQTQAVHREITKILDMLREAKADHDQR